jgi:hypothetical protein
MGWRGAGGAGNDDKSIIIVADVTRGINQRCKKIRKIDVCNFFLRILLA